MVVEGGEIRLHFEDGGFYEVEWPRLGIYGNNLPSTQQFDFVFVFLSKLLDLASALLKLSLDEKRRQVALVDAYSLGLFEDTGVDGIVRGLFQQNICEFFCDLGIEEDAFDGVEVLPIIAETSSRDDAGSLLQMVRVEVLHDIGAIG